MNEERVTVRRSSETVGSPQASNSVVHERISRSPAGEEVVRRAVAFIFGLIQLVIGLRIVLLVLDADRGNGLVSWVYGVSGPLVAPFEGILQTNAVHASGAVLDIAALVALVGWTILELVIFGAMRIASRES